MGLGILPPPWVAPPKAPDVQDFTSSGTWTKPAGAKKVFVECIGGGASGTAISNSGYAAAGGSGGGYSATMYDAGDLSSTESVTVGAGGAPSSGTGSSGGSSFAAGTQAYGGRGVASQNGYGACIAASPVGTGDEAFTGGVSCGFGANANLLVSGFRPPFGGGAGQGRLFTAGNTTNCLGGNAPGRLAGGNGQISGTPATQPGGGGGHGTTTSGAGAAGAVRITTYF